MKNRLACLACGRMLAPFEFCPREDCPAWESIDALGTEPEPLVSHELREEASPPTFTHIKPRID